MLNSLAPLACALALFLCGCSATQQRRSADNEAYHIVQNVERQIFGRTNTFTIDTAFSGRKPADIRPEELIEDRLQTNRRVISLDEALSLAFQHSREYQREKELLYLAALNLSDANYQFSPQFLAGADTRVTRSFLATADEQEVVVTGGARVGVSQLLRSGGRLSATLANDFLRFYTGDPRRTIVSTLSLELFQPLLRGFGRNSPDVESLTQTHRNVIYAIRRFAFVHDEFALNIVLDYFDLLTQKDIIRNNYANYLSRVQATQRLEARAQDREQQSAVDQARQAELTSKNTYVSSISQYFTLLDGFKLTLGLPASERFFLEDAALNEVRQTGLVPTPLDPAEAYRLGIERGVQSREPILNTIDRLEDGKRRIRLARDRLKPGLDFFANATLASDPDLDYTRFDAEKVRASAGLELDLPIDRVGDRNDYRRSLIDFEVSLRNVTAALDGLRRNIQVRNGDLNRARQSYYIQTNALALANRRVESTTMLLEAGRGEIRDLIEAQNEQLRSQNAVTSALVGYQQTRLQLMLDIGVLRTGLAKFWLQDHLANQPHLHRPPPHVLAEAEEAPAVPPEQVFQY